jgi:ribosome-associated protein
MLASFYLSPKFTCGTMNLINPDEVEFNAIRAQGPGGQNVNKVSSAVHLRFDIARSSLTDAIKERLLASHDQRISKEGVIILKAQQSRSQEQNRNEGLQRLQAIIDKAAVLPNIRRATRPTRSSQRKRLDSKSSHGIQKVLRGKVLIS